MQGDIIFNLGIVGDCQRNQIGGNRIIFLPEIGNRVIRVVGDIDQAAVRNHLIARWGGTDYLSQRLVRRLVIAGEPVFGAIRLGVGVVSQGAVFVVAKVQAGHGVAAIENLRAEIFPRG